MTELLRGVRTSNAEYCAQGGFANSGRKIPNLPNKIKTKQMGSLLAATDVLSTRITFFLNLDKKWLSYEPKRYAQIWARPPNFIVFGL